MLCIGEEKKYPENQKRILDLLLQKPIQQKHLAEALAISGAGLLYHLNLLENEHLIKKKTLFSVGNVSVNEISIDPNSIQRARQILGMKAGKYTLITGFGKDSTLGESHAIPAITLHLLSEMGYNIDRIVVFITPESNVESAKRLIKIDKVISAQYEDYRNTDSDVMHQLEAIIQEEQEDHDVILDLTPLTKLLTIKLLELSTRCQIPSVYIGKSLKKKDELLWIYQVPAKA